MIKARKRTRKEKILYESALSNGWRLENALERKRIGFKNALSEW